MLQRLGHEWIARYRLVPTLAAFNNSLLEAHEYIVNNRRVALAKLCADIYYRLARVRAIEIGTVL